MMFCAEGSVCLSARSPSVCLSGSQPISWPRHEPSKPDEDGIGQQPTQVHTQSHTHTQVLTNSLASAVVREQGGSHSQLVCVQRWLIPLRPLRLAAAPQPACRIPLRGDHRLGRDQPLGQPGRTPPAGGAGGRHQLTTCASLCRRAWAEGSWAREPPRVGGP